MIKICCPNIKHLHQQGAKINVKGGRESRNIVFHVFKNGFFDVLEYLRENRVGNVNEDPLLMAAAKGDLQQVKNLIKNGSSPNVEGYIKF